LDYAERQPKLENATANRFEDENNAERLPVNGEP
jgi:hypothetical protein